MDIIKKIHDDAFLYLKSWSEEARTMNSEINPYFYLRSVKDDFFTKGYWFPGNEHQLCISFWSGGDSINKSPNIYLEINNPHGCHLIIVAKDSPAKFSYFEKLIQSLQNLKKKKYKFYTSEKMWSIKLSPNIKDWNKCLADFMRFEKNHIDNYLQNIKFTEYEEFVSRFQFIDAIEFDTMCSRVLSERNILIENDYLSNQNFQTINKLEFALLGVAIQNYQGVIHTKISEIPPDTRWIFITGENGYGKTTLLQAIALGLSSDPILDKYIEPRTRISLELVRNRQRSYPVRTKGSLTQSDMDNNKLVVGYGPVRLNISSTSSENTEAKSYNNVLSLFENETLLKSINYELFATNHSNTRQFEELEKLIKIVTKGRISKIIINQREALFIEKLDNGDELDPQPLSRLAAGFRSIINIVFDIYLRFKTNYPNSNSKEFYGIVLIDEIENHLHPILQKELPKTLSEIFPKLQFIVTTHSPIPLLGAEKNSVILTVNRSKKEGVTIERLDESIDFANLLPNTILTSPIFGFQEIFSESKDDRDFVRVETTYAQVQTNDAQTDRIEKHLNKETASEILKLLKK